MKTCQALSKLIGAAALLAASAQAGTNYFYFDSPASTNGFIAFGELGGGYLVATNGSPNDPATDPSTNGYFAITDNVNSERGTLVFPDVDNGLIVQAFTLFCDLRVGGGTTPPADGFSVNYARSSDPLLSNTPFNNQGWAAKPSGEANDPEMGTQTGLAVFFEAFDDGNSIDESNAPVGLGVRVDNVIITNFPLAVLNGMCADTNSLQTGTNDTGLAGLCWQRLFVQLTTNGLLNVAWKGNTLLTNYVLPSRYAPSSGRIIVGGRCGGLNQYQHIDNVGLLTIGSPEPVVDPIIGEANGFILNIEDSGPAMPDTNTLIVALDGTTIIFDGTNVSSGTVTISKSGIVTSTVYSQTNLFASGSQHMVSLSFSGFNFSGTVTRTNTFLAATYQVLPVTLATPLGSGNSALPGFRVKTIQLSTNFLFSTSGLALAYATNNPGVNGGSGQTANYLTDINLGVLESLGLWGSNVADMVSWSFTDKGFYDEPNMINYKLFGDVNDAGFFTFNNGYADALLPGLPGTEGNYDGAPDHRAANAVAEILTYVEFPTAGFYQMGVDSDDGFEVSVGDSRGGALLNVTAPPGIARPYAAYPTVGNFADASLFPPVSGRVVAANPIDFGGSNTNHLLNASAFKGNIVIFQQAGPSNTLGGGVNFRLNACQRLGAVASIMVVPTNTSPSAAQPTTTIPLLSLVFGDGESILARCTTDNTSPVFATVGGGDQAQILGQFSGPRGAVYPGTLFGIVAPQAGVYPLRVLYQQGAGDASIEWFTQDAQANPVLVNDLYGQFSTNSARVNAFQARTVSGGPPVLSLNRAGNNVVLSWTGVGELQRAASAGGPYYRTANQNSPQTNGISLSQQYFRVRQY
ncbi:exported hypothetical protein [Verrucomicrobia bacterium]|nr:exported hypothetical protein [Verrucomicrobiota bacterium]